MRRNFAVKIWDGFSDIPSRISIGDDGMTVKRFKNGLRGPDVDIFEKPVVCVKRAQGRCGKWFDVRPKDEWRLDIVDANGRFLATCRSKRDADLIAEWARSRRKAIAR